MFTKEEIYDMLDTFIPSILIGGILGCVVTTGMIVYNTRKKEKEPQQTRENNELAEVIVADVNPDEVKVFNEGEQYLSVRLYENSTQSAVEYAVNNIPEGYEVYDIMPYEVDGNTEGYDIWFTNIEPVEVHASYNTDYDQYGYYTFGDPIEKEKTLTK